MLICRDVIKFLKRMCKRTIKSLKEPSHDDLRKRLNFYSIFSKIVFNFFDASSISDYKCSMHFHVVHAVFV